MGALFARALWQLICWAIGAVFRDMEHLNHITRLLPASVPQSSLKFVSNQPVDICKPKLPSTVSIRPTNFFSRPFPSLQPSIPSCSPVSI